MAHEYLTIEELKATLELTSETFADPDLRRAIAAASRGIENLCRRRFWKDTDATSVRYYTPDECGRLRIDDLIDITSLHTDPNLDGTFTDSWTENTDYILEPLNAPADGWPWTSIQVGQLGAFRFQHRTRYAKVTGQFGWDAVPDAIVEATTILASKLVRRAREAPFGVVTFGMEGSAMRVARNDPDVCMLAGDYIRDRIAVA